MTALEQGGAFLDIYTVRNGACLYRSGYVYLVGLFQTDYRILEIWHETGDKQPTQRLSFNLQRDS
jgi:hypothetical protein